MDIILPTKRVGSKVHLAPWIISHLPPHETYIECFGGTGAVLFSRPRSQREVYNDIDGDLHNLYSVVRDRPDELAWDLFYTPYSRREYQAACEHNRHGKTPSDCPVERARQFVVRTRQCFIGGGGETWSTTRKGWLPSWTWLVLPGSVIRLCERLQGVAVENLDYRELFKKWDTEETTFYLDPPYEGVEHAYYEANKEDGFDHRALRDEVEDVKGSVVVSYYRSDEILRLYKGFKIHEVPRKNQIGNNRRQVREILLVRCSQWAEERRHRYRPCDLFVDLPSDRGATS